ncbi:MAG: chemotaxis response regulator protein-glutamate methylesterase [Planctomycetia bacterium]
MNGTQDRKIRVLVVDDSALVRRAISEALARDPALEVVATACDPYVAREKIEQLDPDVLTLDLEMPRMDGLTFLRILMEHHPLPVVVVSSLAQQGSQAALDAVEAGAVDVLAKPDGTMSIGALADKLAFHVKAAAAAAPRLRRGAARPSTPGPLVERPAVSPDARQLIVIGASTGGVEALRQIIPRLPSGLPPIAVVQHISAFFSKAVADRLDAISGIDVREAGDNEPLRPGSCVIAPGDFHLAVEFRAGVHVTRLLRTPPIHHCRPAVDVLFRSAAEAAGRHAVGVLLTGMGSDGAVGMQAIRAAGGTTIAEHESTCVVYGMPRAAVELGVVDRIVPLPDIAAAVGEAVTRPQAGRMGGGRAGRE